MPDSQIYSAFLIKGNSTEGAIFLFNFRQSQNQRPQVGDSVSNPFTLEQFKIIRDEIDVDAQRIVRITDDLNMRVTDIGDDRVTAAGLNPDLVTHKYFVTPSNNPNRITSYTTNKFADDQTLKQLFR
jgi:hypothetical protein